MPPRGPPRAPELPIIRSCFPNAGLAKFQSFEHAVKGLFSELLSKRPSRWKQFAPRMYPVLHELFELENTLPRQPGEVPITVPEKGSFFACKEEIFGIQGRKGVLLIRGVKTYAETNTLPTWIGWVRGEEVDVFVRAFHLVDNVHGSFPNASFTVTSQLASSLRHLLLSMKDWWRNSGNITRSDVDQRAVECWNALNALYGTPASIVLDGNYPWCIAAFRLLIQFDGGFLMIEGLEEFFWRHRWPTKAKVIGGGVAGRLGDGNCCKCNKAYDPNAKNILTIPCAHWLCIACVSEPIRNNKKCPKCLESVAWWLGPPLGHHGPVQGTVGAPTSAAERHGQVG